MSRYFFVLALLVPCSTFAQAPAAAPAAPGVTAGQAGQPAAARRQPPAGSGPVISQTEIRFHPVNESIIEPQTYLYYIQTPFTRESEGVFVPFNESTEKTLLEDFKRLWATSFLDNLWIETLDEPYENGVMGKRVIYHMEERPRVKIVDYTGSTKVERTKIDEKMKELGVSLRLDSFLDEAVVRRVQGLVKSFMADKGYEFAEVTSTVEPLPSGPKLVKVVFDVKEGPKVKVRELNFIGNTAFGDGTLGRQMKSTKAKSWFSWITGKGIYQAAKFEEDAEKIVEYYRNEGYIAAKVGQPEIKVLEDSKDKETRWVQLDVPVDEGPRYRVGEFKFDGNKVVKTEFLEPLFKLKTGDWYTEKNIRKGLEKARELYGGGGYFEFTGYPDLDPVGAAEGPIAGPAQPTVNVTMRMHEGEQYFGHRITFIGHTTTGNNVLRREVRLVEGGIFNTESLKYSVKRSTSSATSSRSKTGGHRRPEDAEQQERGRRHAEAGRAEPQPADLRRRRVAVRGLLRPAVVPDRELPRPRRSAHRVLAGRVAPENYQVAFSEPFLFDRNITGGVDVYKRTLRYIDQFTQEAIGGNVTSGFPRRVLADVLHLQLRGRPGVRPQPVLRAGAGAAQPALADSLLIGEGGHRTISKVTPSFVHNTVDNPIFRTAARASPARWTSPAWAATPTSSSPGSSSPSSSTRAGPRSASARRWNTSDLRQHDLRADHRIALPRRRVHASRLRHPLDRAARSAQPQPGAGRQQEHAVQRRVPDQHCRPGAPGAVCRYRPGAGARGAVRDEGRHYREGRPERAGPVRSVHEHAVDRSERTAVVPAEHRADQRLQDLDERRDPLFHAGAERAVPVDLRQ